MNIRKQPKPAKSRKVQHLTNEDRSFIKKLCETKSFEEFDKILLAERGGELYEAFFNRVIGWPEGISYYGYGSENYRRICEICFKLTCTLFKKCYIET